MSNCMKNIAEGLGVLLYEAFRIDDSNYEVHGIYRITEKCLEVAVPNTDRWKPASSKDLRLLVTGDILFEKLLQMPDFDEVYYVPDYFMDEKYQEISWRNREFDRFLWQRGLVCNTKEKAISLTDKFIDTARWETKKMLAAIKEK